MKGIKPFKLGLMTRPFQLGRSYHLGVSVTAYFPFRPEGALYGDMELWMAITDLLGDQPVLDVGIPKSRSEFLVAGHAFRPKGLAGPTCPVKVKVGGLEKTLYAIGDRQWRGGVPTEPAPFKQMDLSWKRAFGGEGFDKNPLGRGFAPIKDESGREVHPLPNIEAPGQLLTSMKDRPEPAGLGPVDFTWPQRKSLAGTYDKRWLDELFPGFADDMDWRIWNMAAADQQQEEPFRGDEPIYFENMHPKTPKLEARLPGIVARSFVTKRDADGVESFSEVALKLTTVWLFPHVESGVLVFQGATPTLEDDATDVKHILVAGERLGAPRTAEHYRTVLAKRLDPDNAIEVLNDDDLMPPGLTGLGPEIDRVLEMTTSENLRIKRARQRASAEIEASRANIASLGLDPDEHGAKPLDPMELPPQLHELPEYIRKKNEEIEAIKKAGDEERAVRDAATEKFFEEVGLDYDVIREERSRTTSGPPEFKADDYRDMLRRMADEAAAAGHPQDELESYASDPEWYARLQKYEEMSIEGYRMGAHMQSPYLGRTIEESAPVREWVERRHREKKSFAERDLTGVSFSGMDLEGVNFRRALLESADFENANLQGACFDGAVLAHANLTGAKIRGATFKDTNLGKAKLVCVDSGGEVDFEKAQLWGADLTGASLVGAKLEGATLLETVLRNADLSRAQINGVFFYKTELGGAKMTGVSARLAVFMEVVATEIDFGGAMLEEAVFLKCQARGAKFVNAQMTNFRFVESQAKAGDFKGAVLSKANLRGADLREADFSGAQLIGTDFGEANVEGARFYRAVAQGSNWIRANMKGAFFVSADLRDSLLQKADIRGTDFRGANLYRADFALVHSDSGTNVTDAIQLKVKFKPLRPTS